MVIERIPILKWIIAKTRKYHHHFFTIALGVEDKDILMQSSEEVYIKEGEAQTGSEDAPQQVRTSSRIYKEGINLLIPSLDQ